MNLKHNKIIKTSVISIIVICCVIAFQIKRKGSIETRVESSTANDIDSQIKRLSSTNTVIVKNALIALEEAGPEAQKAIPQIALLLGDTRFHPEISFHDMGNYYIGVYAGIALTAIGPSSVGVLTHTIETGNDVERFNAANALGRIADPSVATGLLKALEDSQEDIRTWARQSLLHGKVKFTAPTFINACTNENPYVRSTALLVLGRIKDKDAGETVLRLLHDPDENVRESALLVLARAREWIHDERAFDTLLTALTNKNSSVRSGAAFSLGHYKDSRAIEPLGLALTDEHFNVQSGAASSLGKIGGEEALAELRAALPKMEKYSSDRDLILRAIKKITGE